MPFRFILLLALLTACSPKPNGQSSQASAIDSTKMPKPISQVLAAHTSEWMKIPGVIGTGETKKDGAPAILIFVDSLTDSLRNVLPDSVEGYPVVINETGKVIPLSR